MVALRLQLLFILPYIMLPKITYGVNEPCTPLSCLRNSLYVRLGDMKTEFEQIIIDQEKIIKNQTRVIKNQIDIIKKQNEAITDLKTCIEEQKLSNEKQNETITELVAFRNNQEQLNIQFGLLASDVQNKSRGNYSNSHFHCQPSFFSYQFL